MSNKILITTKLNQSLQISPQLRQAINILQYSTIDLDLYLKDLLNENPLLEETEPTNNPDKDHDELETLSADYSQAKRNHYEASDLNSVERASNSIDLYSHLNNQILNLHFNQNQMEIAQKLIYLIDENGRLPSTDDEILYSLELDYDSMEMIDSILKKIQLLDPIGIAARSLKECLLIQTNELAQHDSSWVKIREFITTYFDEINKIPFEKLLKKSSLSKETFSLYLDKIRELNPFPGKEYNFNEVENIVPELYVKKINDQWHIFLNDIFLPRISINSEYNKLIKDNKNNSRFSTLGEKLSEAKLVLSSIKKRNETLMIIGKYIIDHQLEFLEKGPSCIKSMNINAVSQALEIHESTVSRATNGKYIATPHGLFELKFFFPSYINNKDGSKSSSIAVKSRIKELIGCESPGNVLSDTKIAELLNSEGYNISRRTIVKYRESMNIATSYERSKILSMSDRSEVES